MIKKICKRCKKSFWILPYRIKKAKYCSHKCYGISKIGYTPWNKGKKGLVIMSNETKKKMSISAKGKNTWSKGRKETKEHKKNISLALKEKYVGSNNWLWKGGKTKTIEGYIWIINPNRFKKFEQKYILEHRYIMERYIGHPLKSNEIVHHINGIKTDNRIENLMLFPNIKAHRAFHISLKV